MIKFQSNTHSYTSIVPDDIKWISVTAIVSALKPVFDRIATATKCSVRRPGRYPNKWFGMSVEEILTAWDNEGKRSIDAGHWYHDKIEQQLLSEPTIDGLPIYTYKKEGDSKIAPEQKLTDGIYPEHMVYLESAGLCGQSDIVKVHNNKVHITDHKTSKEIRTKGFTNYKGVVNKMQKPVQHLDDCEFNHYALQLSIYMYIILRHNPLLQLGDITVNHVKLKETGKDRYGYPVHLIENGEPVVESITSIAIPYMFREVQMIIEWLRYPKNRQLITKH